MLPAGPIYGVNFLNSYKIRYLLKKDVLSGAAFAQTLPTFKNSPQFCFTTAAT
jgi:hypothetical protein